MAGELIELDGGVMSMALNLEEDNVSVVILGDDTGIKEGSIAKRTGRVATFPLVMHFWVVLLTLSETLLTARVR